jgi:carbon storage regulator CsrA
MTLRERIADMLVLSRRLAQKIVFPGIQTSVQIVSVKPGVVRLGIDAPEHIAVYREELLDRTALQAAAASGSQLKKNTNESMHLLNNLLNANSVGLALLRRQLALGHTGEMSCTLDKIESSLQNIQQRFQSLDAEPPSAAAPVKQRALVVEDDCNECELLAGFLRLAGMDVHTAGDGAAALDYLSFKGKPDFMLLDMLLPRCDGPTTVRAIRRNPAYAGLRIFGVTGAPVEQFGLDEGPGGIDCWFRKPFNPEMLLRKLDQTLAPQTTK